MAGRDIELIARVYSGFIDKLDRARSFLKRPMTYTEKILFSHLEEYPPGHFKRGVDYAQLLPDRVAMQDATAQMALLQFMHAGMETTAVPASVHCDHLVLAECGAKTDLE